MSNALRGRKTAVLPKLLIPNILLIMLRRYIGAMPATARAKPESNDPWQRKGQSCRTVGTAKISGKRKQRSAVPPAAKDETVCAVIPDKPKKYVRLPPQGNKGTREHGFFLNFFLRKDNVHLSVCSALLVMASDKSASNWREG
jgi:hypothetical protein